MSEPKRLFKKQQKPEWCPFTDCIFVVNTQDAACIGKLPTPEPHLDDFNTHRLCLHAREDEDWHFNIQINKSDAWNLRRILDRAFCVPPEVDTDG